jgi:tetratricopeptide (TPR) repeat protein
LVDARLVRTPNDPAALVLAARTYATTGDMAKTESLLLRALEVAPADLQAYGMLGQLYVMQNKLDQARDKFSELARRQSSPVAAETMVGMILQMQGRPSEAQKQYERVLAIDARAPVAANNLAWLYAESGANLETALQLAQTAKAALPDSAEVSDTLGWVYYKKDMPSQAVFALREAASKDVQNPNYQYHLGMALVKQGDAVNGKMALEHALRIKPDFDGAADARKALATAK